MSDPWLERILADCRDDFTKEACDACEDCGPTVMCRYHSLLSLLMKSTFIDKAHAKSAAPLARSERTPRLENSEKKNENPLSRLEPGATTCEDITRSPQTERSDRW